ncbi:hypothetical protein ACWEL8_22450 [Streptomyces sp. NPDC004690]
MPQRVGEPFDGVFGGAVAAEARHDSAEHLRGAEEVELEGASDVVVGCAFVGFVGDVQTVDEQHPVAVAGGPVVERVGAAGGEEVEPVLVDTRTGGSLKDSKAFGFDAGPADRTAGLSRP